MLSNLPPGIPPGEKVLGPLKRGIDFFEGLGELVPKPFGLLKI